MFMNIIKFYIYNQDLPNKIITITLFVNIVFLKKLQHFSTR